MDRSLVRLQFLLMKAATRRMIRGAKTVRGAFLLIFTLGLMSMGIFPSIILALNDPGRSRALKFTTSAEPILPGLLLAMFLTFLLTSAGELSILFTPAEIDILFPAPFHRRQLLLYKLTKKARGLALMAFLVTISVLPALPSWLAGYVGFFLTLAFMNLAGMVITLVGQVISSRAFSTTRRAIVTAAAILAVAGMAQTMASGMPDREPLELLRAFRESAAGRMLLAPFEVFSRTICSGGIRDGLLTWGSAALAIDLLMLALVFRLDSDYLESAATVSGRIYERMLRTKQGGGVAIAASSASTWIRPRRFPWLGGAGPIAWRQIVLSLRRSRLQIGVATILSAIFFGMAKVQGSAGDAILITFSLIGGLIYLTFLLSMQAPWAFRGDLDHIEGFKTLPVRPTALVLGELSGGVLILTAIQSSMLITSLAVIPVDPRVILAALAFTAPLNTVLLGANNLLFLIYPMRMPTGTTMDFQDVGRALIHMILQGLILIPTLGIPAGVGGIAYLAGQPGWACVAAAWAVLVAELPLILWLIGRAFDQFDPGTQTPA